MCFTSQTRGTQRGQTPRTIENKMIFLFTKITLWHCSFIVS
jgi:hypothetical protein